MNSQTAEQPDATPANVPAPTEEPAAAGPPRAVAAREAAYSDKHLSPGAKFFLAFVTDGTHKWRIGGDLRGRLTISQKDLKTLTGHDPKSIRKWVRELHNYLWVEPYRIPNAHWQNVYCVKALIPAGQPQWTVGLLAAWGRAKNEQGKFSPYPSDAIFSAKNGQSADNGGKSPSPSGKASLSQGESLPLAEGKIPSGRGKDSLSQTPKSPSGRGKDSPGQTPVSPPATHQSLPVADTKVSPSQRERTVQPKETPKEIRRKGDKEGGPAPDEALEKWIKGISGTPAHPTHRSKLEKLESELQREQQLARTKPARDWVGQKIAAVRQLLNPKHPDQLQPAARSPAKLAPPKPQKPITEDELLEGARYLVSLGKADSLMPAQRDALKRAGEWPVKPGNQRERRKAKR